MTSLENTFHSPLRDMAFPRILVLFDRSQNDDLLVPLLPSSSLMDLYGLSQLDLDFLEVLRNYLRSRLGLFILNISIIKCLSWFFVICIFVGSNNFRYWFVAVFQSQIVLGL